jgi:hypothetical protein
MPPSARVFPELLTLKGVRQPFLASFTGRARTRVERRMASMAKITMAISRNTADFIRRTEFAQEKTDAMAARPSHWERL